MKTSVKNRIKNRFERFEEYIFDHMDEFLSVSQFVMGCIMLFCVVISVVANIIMGRITSIVGYAISFLFLAMVWRICRIVYEEMRNGQKK